MADRLILQIFVKIEGAEITQLDGPAGSVVLIPFSGTAAGTIFSGVIRPGGVDRQIVDVNGVRHMSARYILEGTDQAGSPCRIYVDNTGDFLKDEAMPFKTVPSFLTDSAVLAPFLHRNAFRGEGHLAECGVTIKIFEIGAEDEKIS